MDSTLRATAIRDQWVELWPDQNQPIPIPWESFKFVLGFDQYSNDLINLDQWLALGTYLSAFVQIKLMKLFQTASELHLSSHIWKEWTHSISPLLSIKYSWGLCTYWFLITWPTTKEMCALVFPMLVNNAQKKGGGRWKVGTEPLKIIFPKSV